MGRRKTPEDEALLHELKTRVNTRKYQELQRILRQNPNKDMSALLRDILENRPIKVFTRDLTLDNLMEELAKLRMEIKAIGVNINQITKKFNTYPEPWRKEFYAKTAFAEYTALKPRIEQLLTIISKLAKKWLPE
jgi:MobC-like protein